MTTLIIARHGNTFEDFEAPRRVGAGTDLPLTATGRAQAQRIGQYLSAHNLLPESAFCGHLQRTRDTAQLALAEAGLMVEPKADAMFNEIDYGIDENKTEDAVIARVGQAALDDWEQRGVPPAGWNADPDKIVRAWLRFGAALADGKAKTVLAVTSNGIARFAPHLTGDFDGFRRQHPLKISTGALCILDYDGKCWTVRAWNVKP